ncbi:MAG: hypothetical protein JO250_18395 [Armatimonadetes bacterium]|nr:hypothetical protein [Armatimonadota bacterium]
MRSALELLRELRAGEPEAALALPTVCPPDSYEQSPQNAQNDVLTAICRRARSWPQAVSLLLDARGVPNGGAVGDDFFDALDELRARWDEDSH